MARTGSSFAIPAGDAWRPDRAILPHLHDREIVVPVVGAGVSSIAGVPGGSALAEHLRNHFQKPDLDIGDWSNPDDPRSVAADIANGDPDREDEVRAVAAEFVRVVPVTIEPVLTALVTGTRSRMIVTFNYDDSLEEHAAEAGIDCGNLCGERGYEKFEQLLLEGSPPEQLTILHLHGSIEEERTIVLAEGGYASAALNGRISRLANELQHRRTMCMLGTTLDEPYLITAFSTTTRQRGKRHLLFVPRKEMPALRSRAAPAYSTHGIEPVEMPHYHCTRGVIWHLARSKPPTALPPRPTAPTSPSSGRSGGPGAHLAAEPAMDAEELPITAPPGSSTALGDYVPTVIVECDDQRDDRTTDFFAQLSIGRRRSFMTDSTPEFLSETDVATERRSLVIGMPGSGKSELLRYAATLVPAPERPVFVPLNAVSLGPADALTRLVRWASWDMRGGAEITREVLQEQTVHFFLDGLDEVAPAGQARAAEMIVELGRAFPQHAFTVAARPGEANSVFPSDEWRCLKVVPGSVWQRRYLERHNVALDVLLDDLEGGRDLYELLQLPFFLVRVVAMRERIGGLGLWGLVRKLVDEALAEEDTRQLLPLPETPAREWLQALALEMHLAGQTLVTVEEAETVALPDGVTGNTRDICERLVERVMLQPRAKGYVFPHRIIGEALAAETLARRGPTKELLDGIAPEVSSTIKGVRSDWRVALAFLLPDDAQWREAIKSRDPLQWARGVPACAPAEERREAATVIWETYLEWRIWLWNYELPDLIQDAGALGRLLQTDGLDDIVDRVSEGLDHPSPQVQGNAIRALALADGTVWFEDKLLEIITSDARDPVVRRKAAIAASDLDYHDLLPAIVERGGSTSDDGEAQDFSIAATRLARDEELLDVALALARNQGGSAIVLSKIEQRLAPADQLRFLAAFAEMDPGGASYTRGLVLDALEKLPTSERASVAEEVTVAALIWGLDDDLVREVFESDREAVREGLSRVFQLSRRAWRRGSHHVSAFSADELEAAGADARLVELRRHQEEQTKLRHERVSQPEHDGVAESIEPSLGLEEEERTPPPTLSALLDLPPADHDNGITYNARYFAREVPALSPQEKDELRRRMRKWWPPKPFGETIEFEEKSGGGATWRIENRAAAWLWFGPPLDMDFDPRQWAEIAMSGVLFEEQTDWLQRKVTPEALKQFVQVCNSPEGRVWQEALRAIPDPLPQAVAEAVASRLREVTSTNQLREVAERLARNQQREALARLAEASSQFENIVRPYLASVGDDAALAAAFDRLARDLEAGEWPDSEDLFWLEGVRGREDYLPSLFAALSLAYRPEARDIRPRAFSDPVSPLLALIRDVGGERAVAGLDELLKKDGMEFLRLQREAVVQAELLERGSAAARGRLSAGTRSV